MVWLVALAFLAAPAFGADDNRTLGDRARQYLTDMVKLDSSNPPGRETRVAEYLKQVADANGIPCEVIGGDRHRLNFVARLKGNGKLRPLLLMAHSDVVPADRHQWTVDPFSAEVKDGYLYGRGAQDTKSLLAAELAVMVEIKKRGIHLSRDIILLSEADEEAGSTGILWLLQNAPSKIDAEFAINEGGHVVSLRDGQRVFEIQTSEKIPTRITLVAKGTAGHASLPRSDNPVLRLAQAIVKLCETDQPVHLTATTRRYLREMAKLDDYRWLAPLLPKLENPATSTAAANQIRARDPEIDAMLRTSVTPTILHAGFKINVIPNRADGQLDVRRLPSETKDEVMSRFQKIVNDPSITIEQAGGQQMPATEPSSLNTVLYKAIERAISKVNNGDVSVPYMTRGATDGAFLRARGTAVYGVPLFVYDNKESRAHGNDERIPLKAVDDGAELLWQMVLEVAAPGT
ncbi:MAG: M20/M25/M40 family metallo-hydrolase [Bryobacteraceae bacterium]